MSERHFRDSAVASSYDATSHFRQESLRRGACVKLAASVTIASSECETCREYYARSS